MILIDLRSRTPIYEQIKEQIIWLIHTNVYKSDDKLPSIRSLANELSLNVNTVKRAFQELELEGITYSVPGKGIFVSKKALSNKKLKNDALNSIETTLRSAKSKGVKMEEIISLAQSVYEEEISNDWY